MGTMKDSKPIEGWIKYVPEFEGNRDDKNPVTVEVLPLTVRGVRSQTKGMVVKRIKGGGIKSNQADLGEKSFLSHIRNIENLSEEGKPITTAEELLDSHWVELANELEEVITDISMLNEGDIKNFEQRSDGYLERKHGTATNAQTTNNEPGIVSENTEE